MKKHGVWGLGIISLLRAFCPLLQAPCPMLLALEHDQPDYKLAVGQLRLVGVLKANKALHFIA